MCLIKQQEREKPTAAFRTLCLLPISFTWANAILEIKLNMFLKLASFQMAMSFTN